MYFNAMLLWCAMAMAQYLGPAIIDSMVKRWEKYLVLSPPSVVFVHSWKRKKKLLSFEITNINIGNLMFWHYIPVIVFNCVLQWDCVADMLLGNLELKWSFDFEQLRKYDIGWLEQSQLCLAAKTLIQLGNCDIWQGFLGSNYVNFPCPPLLFNQRFQVKAYFSHTCPHSLS